VASLKAESIAPVGEPSSIAKEVKTINDSFSNNPVLASY